ncbi:MAG: hypothetical protein ACYS5V_05380 [Planctomycetota bacterium]|jgi:hypothetical protein
MFSRKRVIIIAAVLAASFGVSLMVSLSIGPEAAPARETTTQPGAEVPKDGLAQELGIHLPVAEKISPRELQLTELVKELQFERRRLRKKTEELSTREKQIGIVMEDLNRQAEELETLRLKLLGPLDRLKEARAELERTRVRIAREEMANLRKMAKSYDVMDAADGSKILGEMCSAGQEDDAVKLLYYMKERSAAKMLTQFTDKAVAARLSQKLKRISKES